MFVVSTQRFGFAPFWPHSVAMGVWRTRRFFCRKEENRQPKGGIKKERKKTDNPREGWEDGTPPPHRDFKKRGVVR